MIVVTLNINQALSVLANLEIGKTTTLGVTKLTSDQIENELTKRLPSRVYEVTKGEEAWLINEIRVKRIS